MQTSKFAFYFDITSILIIFMQIQYTEVFEITNAFPRSFGSSLNRGATIYISAAMLTNIDDVTVSDVELSCVAFGRVNSWFELSCVDANRMICVQLSCVGMSLVGMG